MSPLYVDVLIQVALLSDNFVGRRRHLLDTMLHFRNRLQIQREFPFKPFNSRNKNVENPILSFLCKSFSVTLTFFIKEEVSPTDVLFRCKF